METYFINKYLKNTADKMHNVSLDTHCHMNDQSVWLQSD